MITPAFPSVLLPFGLSAERRPFETYWRTIMPNSKRWLASGRMPGSNADLRPPQGDEIWKGGVVRVGAGSGPRRGFDADTVTLGIDAAMFATGELAGPDTRQLWERVVFPAEIAQLVATAARKGVQAARDPGRILADIEQITGTASPGAMPPPPPPPGRRDSHVLYETVRQEFASGIARMRQNLGDDEAVSNLSDWADAEVPKYRRI